MVKFNHSLQFCILNHCVPAQAKSMALVKHDDKVKELGGEDGKPLRTFHEYNLDALEIPMDARPCAGQHHGGKHGYTLHMACGAAS